MANGKCSLCPNQALEKADGTPGSLCLACTKKRKAERKPRAAITGKSVR